MSTGRDPLSRVLLRFAFPHPHPESAASSVPNLFTLAYPYENIAVADAFVSVAATFGLAA